MNEEMTEKQGGLLEKEGTKVTEVTVKNDTQKSNRNKRILIGVVNGVVIVLILVILIIVVVTLAVGFINRKGDIPTLNFFPNIEGKSALVWFKQGVPESYSQYMETIDSKLKDYENQNQAGEDFLDCSVLTERSGLGKVCVFRLDHLGPECTKPRDYGYNEGRPCVFLKFKELEGWKPIPYNSTNPPPKTSGISNSTWSDSTISVTCDGQYPVDKEYIGPLTYYPPKGFPAVFFPYKGEDDYMSPLVAVQFEKPRTGVVIQVICKAWTQNIHHTTSSDVASVKFEILID